MQVLDELTQVLLALDQKDHASGDELEKVGLTEALFSCIVEIDGQVERVEVVKIYPRGQRLKIDYSVFF